MKKFKLPAIIFILTLTAYQSLFAQPSNDGCLTPALLIQNATCFIATPGSTLNATSDGTANNCTGTADDDVWYKFVATSTTPTIEVDGQSSFDAVVELRSEGCTGTNIICTDAASAGGTEIVITTGLTIGTTYFIKVYSWTSGSFGDFGICIYNSINASIEQTNEAITDIAIYPNPTNGKFTIDKIGRHGEIGKFEIYNIFGEKIYSNYKFNQGITNEIDLSAFSKGIYFVKIYDRKKILVKKIVVQ